MMDDDQIFQDGKKCWRITRLIKLSEGLRSFDLPMQCLNIVELHPKISSMLEFVRHIELTRDADMQYPIILDEEGYVMDGRHRIAKALLDKKESIKAVRFSKNPSCDYEKD